MDTVQEKKLPNMAMSEWNPGNWIAIIRTTIEAMVRVTIRSASGGHDGFGHIQGIVDAIDRSKIP